MCEFLYTDIIKTKSEKENYLYIKNKLITEAVNFPNGTQEEQFFNIIYDKNGLKVALLKPGKEAKRKTPNIYDMYPYVTFNGKEITKNFSFGHIWEYLLKVSIIHKGTFIKILVLLYRLCFFYDHNNYRYEPSKEIYELIINLDKLVLKDGFKDKFNEIEPISLEHFLRFIDILAWNEDVKYNASKGEPYFRNMSESKFGRTNTIISLISAPILISNFIDDIICKTQTGGVIDVKLITSVIQKFTKTRGLCTLSNKELISALEPYIRD